MAIRIDIHWDFVSPSMQTASGILVVADHDQDITSTEPPKELVRCKCKVDSGSLGWTAIDGGSIKSDVFKKYEEQIKTMMRSYLDGMTLENRMCHWIESTLKGA